MSNLLLVPIHVDALEVDDVSLKQFAGPTESFDRLPWDKSPNAPFITERIADPPFGEENHLKKGLHFHWALPQALTKTMDFPIIRLQSFFNLFGDEKGIKIWGALSDAGWIDLLWKDLPLDHALVSVDPQAAIHQSGLDPLIEANYAAILALLQQQNYPTVPNCWVITAGKGQTQRRTTYVASDYLWPIDQQPAGQVAYPQLPGDTKYPPFRYLGHAGPQPSRLRGEDTNVNHRLWDPLTAIGYGDPAFSAMYTNCQNVFGFCDEQPSAPTPDEEYQIVGYYDRPEDNYFHIFIEAFKLTWAKDNGSQTEIAKAKHQGEGDKYLYLDLLAAFHLNLGIIIPVKVEAAALQAIKSLDGKSNAWQELLAYGWLDAAGQLQPKAYEAGNYLGPDFRQKLDEIEPILAAAAKAQMPERTVLVARFTYDAKIPQTPPVQRDKIKLAIGNNSTEALASLVGQELSPQSKAIVEDHLEGLQLRDRLAHRQLDIGPAFEAIRHEKQFTALHAGISWGLKSETSNTSAAAKGEPTNAQNWPVAVGDLLNQLNVQQAAIDKTEAAILATRERIYADWCWYQKREAQHKTELTNLGSGQQASYDFPWKLDGFALPGEGNGFTDPNTSEASGESRALQQASSSNHQQFLEHLSSLIEWGIDVQLQELLQDQKREQQALINARQAVEKALVTANGSQLLREEDFSDWPAFWKNLEQKYEQIDDNLYQAMHRQDKGLLFDFFNDYIRGYNAEMKVDFPAGDLPAEVQKLKEKKKSNQLLSEEGERLRRLQLEANFPSIRKKPALVLVSQAADRFWRPNDPVILVSGMRPSPRYKPGEDGVQHAIVIKQAGDQIPGLNAINWPDVPVITATQTAQSWHPIFMNWELNFSPVKQAADNTYGPDHLTDYYRLGEVDFEQLPNHLQYDNAIAFTGRSVLNPGANFQLKTTLATHLVASLYRRFCQDEGLAKGTPPSLQQFNNWIKGIIPTAKDLPHPQVDREPAELIDNWLQELLAAGNAAAHQLADWYWSKIPTDGEHPIIAQFVQENNDQKGLDKNLEPYIKWCTERSNIKRWYFRTEVKDKSSPLELQLQENAALKQEFISWLKKQLGTSWGSYSREKNILAAKASAYLTANYEKVISWWQPQIRESLHLVIHWLAYRELLQVHGLAQVTDGFDQAMLQRRSAYQLPVHNPLPYNGAAGKAFCAKVRQAVQQANRISPAEDFPFSPWRAGKLKVTNLNLVDNFGRVWPSADSKQLVNLPLQRPNTLALADSADPTEVALLPRLAQAARLDFRWLDARNGVEEMNDHPATSPICGWLLPNNLDNSVFFYGQDGASYGYVDQVGNWRVFPGQSGPILPADIPDEHLAKVIDWLCAQGQKTDGFISDFISTLDVAVENMEPESFGQHEALSLLMGQPLAVVRAAVRLELENPLAYSHNAKYLEADVAQFMSLRQAAGNNPPASHTLHRHSFAYEQVKVPLRLGEFRRRNDGLAGFWVETTEGYQANTFYAPQTTPLGKLPKTIVARASATDSDTDESQFLQALSLQAEQGLSISMLVDPRAKIHANCGILPIRSLEIPPEQYRRALQQIQIAFLATPIISPAHGFRASLPKEPGYHWSWVEKYGQDWRNLTTSGHLRLQQLMPHFGAQSANIWKQLVASGWLQPAGDNQASVVPSDQRAAPELPEAYTSLLPKIELLLVSTMISPFDQSARFDGPQTIREGWLQLSPDPLANQ
ncbi:MAG: hypothetical protein AAF433_04835 [Bacteroidota bacterium]